MISSGADSKLFEEIIRDLLTRGLNVRFQARGASMSPAIRDGDIVEVTPVIVSKLRKDDIVLAKTNNGFRLHRIVFADSARDAFTTRGDCGLESDPELTGAQILGLAQAKEMRVGKRMVSAKLNSVSGSILCGAARVQRVTGRCFSQALRWTGMRKGSQTAALFLAILFVLFGLGSSSAQVAVDATTSTTATLTGAGTKTFTFYSHHDGNGQSLVDCRRFVEHRKQQRNRGLRRDLQRHSDDADRRQQRQRRHAQS